MHSLTGVSSWLEPVAQAALLGLALSVSFAGGGPSVLVLVCYTLTFDFLRSMCHCNVEIIPRCVVQAFPPLKLLVSTPSYVFTITTRLEEKLLKLSFGIRS